MQRLVRFPVVKQTVYLFDAIVGDFYRHDGLSHAAAIAFFILLSTAPLLLLVGATTGFIVYFIGNGNEALMNKVLEAMAHYGHELVPFLGQSLEKDLSAIVDQRQELGIVGIVALLVAASQLFRAFELALDRVFQDLPGKHINELAPGLRDFFTSKAVFGLFVVCLITLFLALNILFHLFFDALEKISPAVSDFLGDPSHGSSLASILIGLITSACLFALIIRMCVPRKILIGFSLIGGICYYCVLFFLGKIYSVYIEWYLKKVGYLYGGLTTFYLLIFWVFCLCVMFLICAEIVKAFEVWFRRKRVNHGKK